MVLNNNSIKTMGVRISFSGSYRIREKKDRSNITSSKHQRFLKYADWHQETKFGRPYLRGTLVRSEMIRQLEDIFLLLNSSVDKKICSGHALYDKKFQTNQSKYTQHRARYKFSNRDYCENGDNACSFCQLLGVFDAQNFKKSVNDEKKYNPEKAPKSVRIHNFKGNKTFNSLEHLAKLRFKNRYDRNSGKAKDYYKIWEADYLLCSCFDGAIEIDSSLVKNINEVKYLIAAGLAGIQYLAGAPCRIDIRQRR